jgi:YfiR/HmsC-like
VDLLRGLATAALLFGLSGPPLLRAQTAAEYELKAAFLYKFASFVEWPHGSAEHSLCIGVIGRDPFGADLDRVVQGKTVNGRPFRIRRFESGKAVGGCQIVFISSSERDRLPSILDLLKGTPTLTVGDVPGFCQSGGMITLRLVGDHIRLQINLEAAERSNLQLSSKLLSLASVVRAGAVTGSQ